MAQITENFYLQYFIELKEFQKDAHFDTSQMVYFRKHFPADEVDRINEAIAVAQIRAKLKENDRSTAAVPPSGPGAY